MWMDHSLEIHAVQLPTARYHYLILLESGDGPLWFSALQFVDSRYIASILRVSVTPYGIRGGRYGISVGFYRVSPVFPCHKFQSTISPFSFISFHFISLLNLLI